MNFKRVLQTYIPPVTNSKVGIVERWLIQISFALLIVGFAMIGHTLYSDSKAPPKVALQPSDWHVVFDAFNECSVPREVSATCPASPQNPLLWTSERMLGSPEFLREFGQNHLLYWRGMKIDPKVLREAANADAPVLLFAPVQGATSVFIDGVFQVRHRYIDQGLPLQVTIPRSRLYENRELSIAVLVSPYPFYAKAKAAGSAFTEGFYTSIDADHFMRWTMFFGFSRHLITFIIFFLLARILWKTSNGQSNAYDYLAGAQFALVMAAISVASIDIMLRLMTVHTYYRLYFLLTLLEAIFLVRMAMSFLRATRSLSIPMGLMLFLGSVAVFGFAPPLWIESTGASLMASIVLPVTYGLCSLAVGYRGWQMLYSKRYQQGAASPERISFLLCAGYTLGLTALLYAWEAIRNAAPDVHWARTLNVMTIYLLVRLITKSRQVTVTAKETAAPVSIPVVAAAASEAKKAA